jgi:hypothetical protein
MKRGIPEEILKFDNVQDVEAVPSLGYGSPQMRDIASQSLMALLPFMDEEARNTALRMRVCAIPGLGQQAADVFFPSLKKKGFPTITPPRHLRKQRSARHQRASHGDGAAEPRYPLRLTWPMRLGT